MINSTIQKGVDKEQNYIKIMNLDRFLVSIMLVAFAYVPLRAQTFNNA